MKQAELKELQRRLKASSVNLSYAMQQVFIETVNSDKPSLNTVNHYEECRKALSAVTADIDVFMTSHKGIEHA